MRLAEIAELLTTSSPDWPSDASLTDLAFDSRAVIPGSLFVCWRGKKSDGHDFAAQAIQSGAKALLCERALDLNAPQVIVENGYRAMNRIASPFFGYPSRKMKLAGVTGTNGKTTTSFMLHSILTRLGPTGLVGTIHVRAGDEVIPGVRTTPQSADLQRLMKKMVDSNMVACAMEATSVGISQGRLDGCEFDVCVFTNLSQDHLDDHLSMEEYFRAKRGLFEKRFTSLGLINADDEYGRRLIEEVDIETKTFGLNSGADFVATEVELTAKGSRFRARGDGVDLSLEIHLPARYNVANALAAAAAAHLIGVPKEAIVEGLSELKGIPGRFQFVDEGQDFKVVVDYAHTPDGLAHVLSGARSLVEKDGGRVIVVFGCGGDRDKGKRPLMGKLASELADIVFITSDNPRSEDPMTIIAEVESGIEQPPPEGLRAVPDRADAIESAIETAKAADIVVIAGKGHETGQEFSDWRTPFDDAAVAIEAIKRS